MFRYSLAPRGARERQISQSDCVILEEFPPGMENVEETCYLVSYTVQLAYIGTFDVSQTIVAQSMQPSSHRLAHDILEFRMPVTEKSAAKPIDFNLGVSWSNSFFS
jgi:hypothetical protein